MKGFNKKFILLWVGCLLGALSIIPYILLLKNGSISSMQLIAYMAQNAALYGILCYAGLYFTSKIGLSLFVDKHKKDELKNTYLSAIGAGLFVGITILFFDVIVFRSFQPSVINPPWYYGLLASLYGAINEEVQNRLFLFSFLVWLLQNIFHSRAQLIYVLSIVVTALLFGILHLPTAFQIMPVTPFMIARILFLNAIGGIAFGYLFWKKNLVAAMGAHFIADLIIHVIFLF